MLTEQDIAKALDGKFYGWRNNDMSVVVDLNFRAKPVVEMPNILPIMGLTLIKHAVAKIMGVSVDTLNGESKKYKHATARQVFCYVARKHTTKGLPSIGKSINRNHSTVLYAIKVVSDNLNTKGDCVPAVERLMAEWTSK
jgi:Bacterial dnaA protein helix-turn-helix